MCLCFRAAVIEVQLQFPVCMWCSSVASSLEQKHEAAARLHVRLKNIWLLALLSPVGIGVMSVAGLQGPRCWDVNWCATSLDYLTETF